MQDYHYALTGIYVLLLIYTTYRVIMDTDSPTKTSAYILLIYAFPVIGMLTYYIVGVNYRKKKIYEKKLEGQEQTLKQINEDLKTYTEKQLLDREPSLGHFDALAHFLKIQTGISSHNNKVELLVNGEQKFPALYEDLRNAKNHIHFQYYIYEDDAVGEEVANILMQKAQEGVEVRFTYDDFGSKLKKSFIDKLKNAGVKVFPFYKIGFPIFMNRINYRNHRKIVVIDGTIGYVGGINISNRYLNDGVYELFWRDTHIRLEGVSVMNLQFIFMTDWNFCSGENVPISNEYFSYDTIDEQFGDKLVQICYSGPDSSIPNIMYSLIQAVIISHSEVLITNPYFIPEKSFVDSLKIASAAGVDVKLLVPGVSDSWIVNAIAHSYYGELMEEGIEIYRYNKGFVHAKTMVCDQKVSFVGTANLDERSFNLNFEVNATIYDEPFSKQLRDQFFVDLKDSERIDYEEWKKRPKYQKFFDKLMRLMAPLM